MASLELEHLTEDFFLNEVPKVEEALKFYVSRRIAGDTTAGARASGIGSFGALQGHARKFLKRFNELELPACPLWASRQPQMRHLQVQYEMLQVVWRRCHEAGGKPAKCIGASCLSFLASELQGTEEEGTFFQSFIGDAAAVARLAAASHTEKLLREAWPPNAGFSHEGGALTYGEATAAGCRSIARGLGLDSLAHGSAVLLDLGCGVGRLLIRLQMDFPSVSRSIGIELAPKRVELAQKAWAYICSRKNFDPASVSFWAGDMLDMDVSEATHLYVSSCFMDDATLEKLAKKLAQEAIHMQALVSNRSLPGGLSGFVCQGRIDAEMTWSTPGGRTEVHVYRRAYDLTTAFPDPA